MRKKIGGWLAGVALLYGCLVSAQPLPGVLKRGKADTQECHQWVEQQLSEMSLKEKIGQLFIHTVLPVNTPQNRNHLQSAVKEYKVGGLLFSGGEVVNQVQLTNLAQEQAKVPLLITFDGEWGLSMRLKGTTRFPRNRVLGCIQNDELLYEYGREVARQCREIGVQVNFAPVADVDVNPRNPVIHTRSFGADPHQVARKVVAYARGLEAGGVLSVSKHFPGHGDTEVDSHKALPVLPFDRARLDRIELYPFRQVVKAGLGGVMVGHLEVPALGNKPASISSDIVQGVLQKELGFQGLTFTDALEMKGISQNGNVSVQALLAGNDLLLVPRNLKRELASVVQAVKDGTLSEAMITEKCRKVLTYKYALGLNQKPHIQLSGLMQRLNTPEAADLLLRLYQAAVTVPVLREGMLPLDARLTGTTVLSIGKSASATQPFCEQLQKYVPVTRLVAGSVVPDLLKRKLRASQRVIVAVTSTDFSTYRNLLQGLPADIPVVYVYLLPLRKMDALEADWKRADAVVLGHTDEADVQRYVADVLAGKQKTDGRLSVGVGRWLKPGTGETLDPASVTDRAYRAEDFGMKTNVLQQIDDIAREGIRAKAYPGCQIVILKDGKPVYDKAFGTFTYEGTHKVTRDDLYDLASLSKTTATLLAVMKLYDQGKFGLTDRIGQYVTALQGSNKERITIEDLLLHQSGIPAFWPFYRQAVDPDSYDGPFFKARPDARHHQRVDTRLYAVDNFRYKKELMSETPTADFSLQVADGIYLHRSFHDSIVAQIADTPLRDRRYRYSCLNFMLLKEMVEQLSGQPLDQFLDEQFYRPMGMKRTAFLPLRHFKKEEIVPTVKGDYLRKGVLQGYVHDEAAAFLGGVSGNAGLFSTARDVARVYQMLLDGGVYNGQRYLSKETCQLFLTHTSKISRRGLGFDKPDRRNVAKSPCAEEAPREVVGHTGFTGTCAWADPKHGLVFVFLSNRVYPQPFNHKQLMRLNIRPRIQQLMYQALIN